MSQSFYRRPLSIMAAAMAATITPIIPRRKLLPPLPLPKPRNRRWTPGAFGRREGDSRGMPELNRRLARATGPDCYDAWKLSLWAKRRAKREHPEVPA